MINAVELRLFLIFWHFVPKLAKLSYKMNLKHE